MCQLTGDLVLRKFTASKFVMEIIANDGNTYRVKDDEASVLYDMCFDYNATCSTRDVFFVPSKCKYNGKLWARNIVPR